MKKITLLFLLAFLGGITMQAQNLLTNGDFEGGMVDWFGNAFNVQEDGGNSFNFANVETAGNAFDVNLSQGLEIIQGETYTLTFDASSDGDRTIIAGIGLNEGPFTADIETVSLTTDTQSYSLTFTATFGLANSRVLFDMGAETGVVVLDNVSLTVDNGMTEFDDGLLDNGDFEDGMVVWIGNAFNVQEDGGNNFNFANVETAGNPFDVNLSQVVEITQGETYTLSFDASSDVNRTIIAGIGLNEAPFEATVETVNLTTETQTFTLTLEATNFGIPNSRVLFDMGAETGVVVIDNVSLFLEDGGDDPVVFLPVDFELDPMVYDFVGFEGADSAIEANPDATGVNTSANVLRSTKTNGAQFFAGTFLNLDAPIDFSESSTIEIDTWSPKENIPVRIALENQTTGNQIFVDMNTTVENTWETIAYDFSGQIDTNIDYNRVVVFFEFIVDLPGDGTTYFYDNLRVGEGTPNIPLVAAPTPPNRAEDAVFSIFSNAYTNQPDVVFGAFGVGTQDITTIQIEGDDTQQIVATQPDPQFLLVDWGVLVDNTAMTHFHMDYWIDTSLSAGLIANPLWSNHVGDAGETSSFGLTNPVTTFGEWVSVDVPLTDFDFGNMSNNQQRDALRQFVLTVAGAENGVRTIFLDNVYLHNNTTLSTEEFSTVDVSVYPNPSSERWTVTTSSDVITMVAVYDLLGRKVSEATPNVSSFDINASNLRTGIYLATITTNQGQETIKLIKR